nr:EOG090X0APF [Lepidurus arcticus]
MELPHLGKHCSEKSCNQLDFLPVQCDACNEVFCKDHTNYESHNCTSVYKKNVQVPVCPLCSQPVPGRRGEAPDLAVGDHIDRDCQSDPAKAKRKVFANRCSLKGCKIKEVVPVICNDCKSNFCLRHRHTADHQCTGNRPADRARASALARLQASSIPPKSTHQQHLPRPKISAYQGTLSEDESLARALQASTLAMDQEEADRQLALALEQSERDELQRQRNQRSQAQTAPSSSESSDRCCIA